MAKLEAAIAARQQEEEEARLKTEQEKETAIRSQQKEKVNAYQHLCTVISMISFLGFEGSYVLPGRHHVKTCYDQTKLN